MIINLVHSRAVDQNGSIAWDPITGLCELCVARRLGPPEYEFNVVVVTNTTNTAFHQHTVKCLVRYYSVTFWAEGKFQWLARQRRAI